MSNINKIESLDVEMTAPPSKSISHRAIFLASLAKGETRIENLLKSDDIDYTLTTCKDLGAIIEKKGKYLVIKGTDGNLSIKNKDLFIGNSGTTMRFLTSYACLLKDGKVTISGIERMHERPIGELVSSLHDLGANIKYLQHENYPPLLIYGTGLKGGKTTLKGDISSQFFSSLLISCLKSSENTQIYFQKPLKSKPYIDLTIDIISKFKGKIIIKDDHYFIPKQQELIGHSIKIEGDFSSSSYFLAMAAVLNGKIKIQNLNANSKQGDRIILDILEQMGAKIKVGENWVILEGDKLNAIEFDFQNYPDLVPTIAVVSAFANGQTIIKNVEHLQYKESNRITAIMNELEKIGIKSNFDGKDLFIEGKEKSFKPAKIETYNDHRIAMSFSVAAVKLGNIEINNPEVVAKSFPDFFKIIENF
ncbi:MAG: 3-phosphoshikimate 1-carboxyvinyltransferase [Candidatus Lokiarchaeota archaeon]|nr:3-phosphoshikimate 1-carboxyvinyltransferase [Candidatus Lokiarchaeota archaeon]